MAEPVNAYKGQLPEKFIIIQQKKFVLQERQPPPAKIEQLCVENQTTKILKQEKENDKTTTTVDLNENEADEKLALLFYYHGLLPRDEIETLLLKDGDFLLRKSDVHHKPKYVLSIYWKGDKRHIVLHRNSTNKNWYIEKSGESFEQPGKLIDHYQKGKIPIFDDKIFLKNAIGRPSWQITRSDVQLCEKIGGGAFGEVYRAQLKTSNGELRPCAVKRLRIMRNSSKKEREKFIMEARIMRKYSHENIVRLLGVVCQDDPIMIIMELVAFGSLLMHLRNNAATITLLEKPRYCVDASRGLAYLEKMGCIHRDVAARNCLIGKEGEIKITDFGLSLDATCSAMSREPQTLTKMPIKWLAPEVLTSRNFSSKADVWAFGIMMWEIFMDGKEPYPGLNNQQVARGIRINQIRNKVPPTMPPTIICIMSDCWQQKPEERPTAKQLKSRLESAYKKGFNRRRRTLAKTKNRTNLRLSIQKLIERIVFASDVSTGVLTVHDQARYGSQEMREMKISTDKLQHLELKTKIEFTTMTIKLGHTDLGTFNKHCERTICL